MEEAPTVDREVWSCPLCSGTILEVGPEQIYKAKGQEDPEPQDSLVCPREGCLTAGMDAFWGMDGRFRLLDGEFAVRWKRGMFKHLPDLSQMDADSCRVM